MTAPFFNVCPKSCVVAMAKRRHTKNNVFVFEMERFQLINRINIKLKCKSDYELGS